MGVIQERVTPEFKKWVGYCEKQKASQLGTYDQPESYTNNAGSGNYTVFADLYAEKTGINVQGCAWCDCFVDTIFIHLFGVDKARKLLNGFSAYTPTSAEYFKSVGRWHDGKATPKEGDQIFLASRKMGRICHTEYVYKVDDGRVYTVGGNTSSGAVPENEGGCVCYKSYPIGMDDGTWYIAGYGRPNYELVETETPGWRKAADGVRWWYDYGNGAYAVGWKVINHHWYYFDDQGYMLTGWQTIGKETFFLDDTRGGMLEGACWHSDERGAMSIWYV